MFCPKCGKADQLPESFCRRCGNYLPDFDKIKKKETSPEEHLLANAFLNLLTAVVSISLAITLYAMFFGKDNTPVIIYLTAGFLTAIFGWQVQTFWRTVLLKKHFKKLNPKRIDAAETENRSDFVPAAPNSVLLNEADLTNVVPPSVTDATTRNLSAQVRRKSS